jgi:hypothetical protein
MTVNHRDIGAGLLTAAIMTLPVLAGYAVAANYPVTGKWTYEAKGDGPAKDCGTRYMDFQGEQRFDTGGGVPAYRNRSVEEGSNEYRIVDEFNTGQINARLTYSLRKIDDNHIELKMPQGRTIMLQRCE